LFITILILIIACGDSTNNQTLPVSSQAILDTLGNAGIGIKSSVVTYTGQSLYEYIDGGAETYHQYGFIEVSTADYKVGGSEITTDIYRFDNADHAFGIYSTLRPDGLTTIKIGVEGVSSPTSFDFVKGDYLVRLVCYEGNEKATKALAKLAHDIEKLIPGKTKYPDKFALFPTLNRIPGSNNITAQSYLGQTSLTDVYSVDIKSNGDNFRLFLTDDPDGSKFSAWIAKNKIDPKAIKSLKGLPFDDGKVIQVSDFRHGKTIAGLKDGRLIGVIGNPEKSKAILKGWLNILNKSH